MVSLASVPLTKVGFRRDVRLFLSFLVGLFAILILSLLVVLRTTVALTEQAIDRMERAIVDIAVDAVERAGPEVLSTQLVFLRGRFNIAAIELVAPDGSRLISGEDEGALEQVNRKTKAGTLRVYFDAAPRQTARRLFLATAAICIAATSLAAALLFLYLPRITRPIEDMLDHARELGGPPIGDQEETAYLIETFRASISTMKSQEEELKRLHEREKSRADDLERVTAALTRSLTSGFVAVDARGRIVDINSAGREILGIESTGPVSGRMIDEVIPLSSIRASLIAAAQQQLTLNRAEMEDERAGGEPVIIGLTTVPLRNEAGGFVGLLALFTDLTPIRRLEARVQEMATFAQLGEISAGIAHELRSSLSTILGYVTLARKAGLDELAESRLRNAEKEAGLVLQAIERLLAFAGPFQLKAEPVDLRELVGGQVAQFADTSPDVKIDVSGPPVTIEGDRVLLSRAVENLLRNAIDAVRQKGGGSIRVTLRNEPVPAVVIADDGVGFDPRDTARLLLPFHSNKPNGFGMGLPLAKKIVLLHGGTLRLQGESGKGATATIEFHPQAGAAPT